MPSDIYILNIATEPCDKTRGDPSLLTVSDRLRGVLELFKLPIFHICEIKAHTWQKSADPRPDLELRQ